MAKLPQPEEVGAEIVRHQPRLCNLPRQEHQRQQPGDEVEAVRRVNAAAWSRHHLPISQRRQQRGTDERIHGSTLRLQKVFTAECRMALRPPGMRWKRSFSEQAQRARREYVREALE